MKCDCCGRRRRLFESYSSVKTEGKQIHLCVICTNLLYKMRDFASDYEWKEYAKVQQELEENKKSFTQLFDRWYKEHILAKHL